MTQFSYGEPRKIKKGMYIMIGNGPCKVIDIRHFKPGKHGTAKYAFVGIDLITDKKRSTTISSDHQLTIPIVIKNKYEVLNIDQDYISLLDAGGVVKDDINLPKGNLKGEIIEAFEDGIRLSVTVLAAAKQERIIEYLEERD